KRPWTGNPWIAVDDGFIDLDAETGLARHDEIAVRDFERLFENFFGQREWVHARAHLVRVARIFQPLDHHFRPADAEMRRGQDFERRAPAMKGELHAFVRDFAEQPPRHGEAALAADVHLHVIHSLPENQIEKAQ